MSESVNECVNKLKQRILPMLPIAPIPKAKRCTAKPAPQHEAEDEDRPDAGPTEEALLDRLEQGAEYCRRIEELLAKHVGPELDTIMKLHRLIILKLSTQAEVKPELWDVLKDLMKPVLDWARLQEQQKDREFAERKHREQMEADKTEASSPKDPAETALNPETIKKIESQLKLL